VILPIRWLPGTRRIDKFPNLDDANNFLLGVAVTPKYIIDNLDIDADPEERDPVREAILSLAETEITENDDLKMFLRRWTDMSNIPKGEKLKIILTDYGDQYYVSTCDLSITIPRPGHRMTKDDILFVIRFLIDDQRENNTE
jgi:hypothetical protein